MSASKYKAFISYSHQDKTWANWLHKRLETYPVPKRIIGSETSKGIVPRRLTPIFRDREELEAAGSLSDKIQAALVSSENMVVLCSPRSAKSHWVNQEILQYKRLHPNGDIFSVIADGEPFASDMPGREDEECFPPALRFEIGTDGELRDKPAEPLAADLRPQGDGKRGGSLKLIAGLIGVGLDELIQRDLQRARKRVMAATGTSLAGMLIMATLTGFALTARKEADARRNDAEGLIEFMLTDLREKLEPVGRLDVLASVGQEAVSYYDGQDIKKMKDDALGRRARVFHFLGELEEKQGNIDLAIDRWQENYESTKELLGRNPGHPDHIFNHAQSAFWVGYGFAQIEDYSNVEPYYQEYKDLADQLVDIDPDDLDWKMEQAWGFSNLAFVFLAKSQHKRALEYSQQSVNLFEAILAKRPDHYGTQFALAKDGYSTLARVHEINSPISDAIDARTRQLDICLKILATDPQNTKISEIAMWSRTATIESLSLMGETKSALDLLKSQLSRYKLLSDTDKTNIDKKRYVLYQSDILSKLYLQLGLTEAARQELEKSEPLWFELQKKAEFPDKFKANFEIPRLLARGEIFYRNGDYLMAQKTVATILDVHPSNIKSDLHAVTSNYIKALLLAGKIETSLKNHEIAEKRWREILGFDPSKKSLTLPANRLLFFETYMLLGMKPEAENEKRNLLKLGVSERYLQLPNQEGENNEP